MTNIRLREARQSDRAGRYSLLELARNIPAINLWRSTLAVRGIDYGESSLMDGDDECITQTFTV